MNIYRAAPTNTWSLSFCGLNRGITLICLCVCLGVFVSIWEFITHLETSPATNFTYTRQSWALSSKGSLTCHILLWHGPTLNGHLRGPVTLTCTPNAQHLTVELSLTVSDRGSNHDLLHVSGTLYLYNTAAAPYLVATHEEQKELVILYEIWHFGDVALPDDLVKGRKILSIRSVPTALIWACGGGGVSQSCHVYCDTSPCFLRSHP